MPTPATSNNESVVLRNGRLGVSSVLPRYGGDRFSSEYKNPSVSFVDLERVVIPNEQQLSDKVVEVVNSTIREAFLKEKTDRYDILAKYALDEILVKNNDVDEGSLTLDDVRAKMISISKTIKLENCDIPDKLDFALLIIRVASRIEDETKSQIKTVLLMCVSKFAKCSFREKNNVDAIRVILLSHFEQNYYEKYKQFCGDNVLRGFNKWLLDNYGEVKDILKKSGFSAEISYDSLWFSPKNFIIKKTNDVSYLVCGNSKMLLLPKYINHVEQLTDDYKDFVLQAAVSDILLALNREFATKTAVGLDDFLIQLLGTRKFIDVLSILNTQRKFIHSKGTSSVKVLFFALYEILHPEGSGSGIDFASWFTEIKNKLQDSALKRITGEIDQVVMAKYKKSNTTVRNTSDVVADSYTFSFKGFRVREVNLLNNLESMPINVVKHKILLSSDVFLLEVLNKAVDEYEQSLKQKKPDDVTAVSRSPSESILSDSSSDSTDSSLHELSDSVPPTTRSGSVQSSSMAPVPENRVRDIYDLYYGVVSLCAENNFVDEEFNNLQPAILNASKRFYHLYIKRLIDSKVPVNDFKNNILHLSGFITKNIEGDILHKDDLSDSLRGVFEGFISDMLGKLNIADETFNNKCLYIEYIKLIVISVPNITNTGRSPIIYNVFRGLFLLGEYAERQLKNKCNIVTEFMNIQAQLAMVNGAIDALSCDKQKEVLRQYVCYKYKDLLIKKAKLFKECVLAFNELFADNQDNNPITLTVLSRLINQIGDEFYGATSTELKPMFELSQGSVDVDLKRLSNQINCDAQHSYGVTMFRPLGIVSLDVVSSEKKYRVNENLLQNAVWLYGSEEQVWRIIINQILLEQFVDLDQISPDLLSMWVDIPPNLKDLLITHANSILRDMKSNRKLGVRSSVDYGSANDAVVIIEGVGDMHNELLNSKTDFSKKFDGFVDDKKNILANVLKKISNYVAYIDLGVVLEIYNKHGKSKVKSDWNTGQLTNALAEIDRKVSGNLLALHKELLCILFILGTNTSSFSRRDYTSSFTLFIKNLLKEINDEAICQNWQYLIKEAEILIQ